MGFDTKKEPIELKIKTIWQGRIGVHEKYLDKSDKEGRGFLFKHGEDTMAVPFDQIPYRVVAKTEKPFVDRFTNQPYHLYYFDWKPDPKKQPSLL